MELQENTVKEALTPAAVIAKKRDNHKLSHEEIHWFINEFMQDNIKDYQMTALLMAGYINGLDEEETKSLTDAMLYSGKILPKTHRTVVDKHSTGGVGDKTSFIVAPIAAAAGVKVPMVSGRGLGHTGGTLDKAQSIHGFITDMPLSSFARQLEEHGLVLVGQTNEIAPADKLIYSLRDVTATVSSIPFITASIMSKKLAEGISGLVMDIKVGNGAFIKDKKDADRLAHSIMNTATRFGCESMAIMSDMNQPLGHMVGNSLEIVECIEALKGQGPEDLMELSHELAGAMIFVAGLADSHESGITLSKEMIRSGKALSKFREMVRTQHGDESLVDHYDGFPIASERTHVKATHEGYICQFDVERVGNLLIELGGGRKISSDPVDVSVGFCFHKKLGQRILAGETVATIYHHGHQRDLAESTANELLESVIGVSSNPAPRPKLIHDRLGPQGCNNG